MQNFLKKIYSDSSWAEICFYIRWNKKREIFFIKKNNLPSPPKFFAMAVATFNDLLKGLREYTSERAYRTTPHSKKFFEGHAADPITPKKKTKKKFSTKKK